MKKHKPHKTHSSPLNNNHELIVEQLCKQTPKRVIAAKIGVGVGTLNFHIAEKEIMKEVFLRMARKLPESLEERKAMYMTATEALKVAEDHGIKVTRSTLLRWAKDEDFGFQPGGVDSTWYINRNDFNNFLTGMAGEKREEPNG